MLQLFHHLFMTNVSQYSVVCCFVYLRRTSDTLHVGKSLDLDSIPEQA